jgi:regulator of protease activity HflC (stomatin/prohibitin superfamily)
MAIFVLVLIVFAFIILMTGVRAVPQGYQCTVERFGRYTTTLNPGLHFIVPIFDRIGHKVSVMEQVLDIPSQEVITRDNAMVRVDGVAYFQVFDAPAAVYEVMHLEHAILNLTMTNLRTVLGSMDLDEMLSRRDQINSELLSVVDLATNPWGVKITRIDIKDISPPPDLVESMARQMKAEREKRAAILEAEGKRQAAILEAEGLKQSSILEAEGNREASYRDAEARERMAQAEANAITSVSQAIIDGNANAVNYFVAQKYVEALGQLAASPNNKVTLMPLEASSILGSVAGIAQIAKEAFGKDMLK